MNSSYSDILVRIERALEATRVVFEGFAPGEVRAEFKAGHDPVTEADRTVDAVLRKNLLRDGEGWLSEESADDLSRLDRERVWVVDHGVCFHADPKLRTVIWDFAGEAIEDDLASDLARADLSVLERWLTAYEVDAARARLEGLLGEHTFPDPPEDRRAYPWPPV